MLFNHGDLALYRDVDLTPDEENEIINKIAKKIQEQGLDMYATFMIESIKPLSFIGANMGRAFFAPVFPALSASAGITGEKLFQIVEKRDNADKLIKAIEKLTKEEKARKKIEKGKKIDGKKTDNKWWHCFFKNKKR